jgi:sugar/nucleoside kinase (ribokinase family)
VRSETPEIVVAGHICLDMIPQFGQGSASIRDMLAPGKLTDVGPLTTSTGGPVSNTGLALHRLGFPVQLMGKVGDDVVGRAIIEFMREQAPGLEDGMIVTDESPSSYTVVISPPGVDRIFLHCPGANDTFNADDVDYDKLAGARLFHFGYPPLMRRMYTGEGRELEKLLARVKERSLVTSLDMARPDPASEAGRVDWRAILGRALPYVDIFLPSFDETLFMLDRARFDTLQARSSDGDLNAQADGSLLRALSDELIEMGAAVVALKLGAHGLYLCTTPDATRLARMDAIIDSATWAGRELLAPCFVVDVAGTTGSGDCTIAGFLGGVVRGLPSETVLTFAVAVGACNVEQADATSGIPLWSTVVERIRRGWKRVEVVLDLEGWSWDADSGVWRGE